MKLPPSRTESFLKSPDKAVKVVLLYGPDGGLARERSDRLGRTIVSDLNDPFRVSDLTGSMIVDDPARLSDEAAAISMLGGRRLVRVSEATDKCAAAFTALLAGAVGDALVVVEAGDLDKKSKLRSLIEGAENAVAIPCYVEEGEALERAIAIMLREQGLGISRDALLMLASKLPPDRMAIRGEIEKLATYCLGSAQVELADVEACLGDEAEASFDDVSWAVGDGDLIALDTALGRLWAEGTSPVAILRTVQRHILRLHLASGYVEAGDSPSMAMKKLRPPVFFKREPQMTAQIQRWSSQALQQALIRIAEAEVEVKRTGTPDIVLCSRTLMQVTQLGRSKRG